MNSVDCSERRLQSLSRRYLSLKKGSPRESNGGGGGNPILLSYSPRTAHYLILISQKDRKEGYW